MPKRKASTVDSGPAKRKKSTGLSLQAYSAKYRHDLFNSVVPFWLKHSIDHECGGFFTALDRDGTVYDTGKYLWLQGREVYMFSRLYNTVKAGPAGKGLSATGEESEITVTEEQRASWLAAARHGAEFLRRHATDPEGRLYFSTTRDGQADHFQRKPYAAVFYIMGYLEFWRAIKHEDGAGYFLDAASDMYVKMESWVKDATLLGRIPGPAGDGSTRLADVMVMAALSLEFLEKEVGDREEHLRRVREAMANIRRHYDSERRILMEIVGPRGVDHSTPAGRLFNPGHSIEVAWFLLHCLQHFPSDEDQTLACDIIEGSLVAGWDTKEYGGGLLYMKDILGKPLLDATVTDTGKLWWPHTEAIYALVLVYSRTREQRWLDWLEKVDGYAYSHFVDQEYGEWFGYCDRHGVPSRSAKGGNYKGFFHVPRALLFSFQLLDGLTE